MKWPMATRSALRALRTLCALLALWAFCALGTFTVHGVEQARVDRLIGKTNAGQLADKMRAAGLVDLATVDPTITVRLAYATTDNFAHKDMYGGGVNQAWMRPEIAQMIARAQAQLRKARPGYSLLVLDAARPFSVQRYMFSLVEGTPQQKYVANPNRGGGKHNYGVAVDITVIDADGRQLDMGSPFDHFGAASHTGHESDLVARGVITRTQAANRKLLTDIMKGVGFSQDPNEWWHFDRYTMAELRQKYKRLDF